TYLLLEAARAYWAELLPKAKARFRFHHVSTDEVFGALAPADPPFTAATPYAPRSPYAASKAAADHLVRAWFHTYGVPTIVSNTTNNYGPWQFPEKLIPLVTLAALEGREMPVYGSGTNRRDWLFVEDHASALVSVMERGEPGATYCIGGRAGLSNLEVVRMIAEALDELAPDPAGPHDRLIRFVADRPGHDFRYEIDPSAAERALGWRATHDFRSGLRLTLRWYLAHREWLERARSSYGGERLGQAV
ncbi:MAG: dTDP-glucose 4,6-dehydratase, partial [Acetobacteraceae bacterium]